MQVQQTKHEISNQANMLWCPWPLAMLWNGESVKGSGIFNTLPLMAL